jgi:hypothetical protein
VRIDPDDDLDVHALLGGLPRMGHCEEPPAMDGACEALDDALAHATTDTGD